MFFINVIITILSINRKVGSLYVFDIKFRSDLFYNESSYDGSLYIVDGVVNSESYSIVSEVDAQGDGDWYSTTAQFQTSYYSYTDFKDFPFGYHDLDLKIESNALVGDSEMKVVKVSFLNEIKTYDLDFVIQSIVKTIGNYGGAKYDRFVITTRGIRDPDYYFNKIITMITLLTIITISLHLIDIDSHSVRIGGSLTTYLTLTATLSGGSFEIPVLPFRTKIDSFILANQLIMFWIIMVNILNAMLLSDGITNKQMRQRYKSEEFEMGVPSKNDINDGPPTRAKTIKKNIFIVVNPIWINRLSFISCVLMFSLSCILYLRN